ncbi:MAG: hypothetical protein ACO2PN_11680 [Pyrobaculum sp.]|jgi:hypothetical protein
MHRILAIYTFAMAVAIFLFILSPIFLFLYGNLAVIDAIIYLVSGILVTLFIYDYMRYSINEWGEFAPQGTALTVFFVLSYAIMYMSLMSLSIFGAGALNLAIWASVMVAAVLILYVLRNVPFHITGTDPVTDTAAGVKTLPLALVVGIPLGWIFLAIYEGARMIARGARIAGATVFMSLMLPFIIIALIPHLNVETSVFTISVFSPFVMQYAGIEVLAWPGIIAWEELTSRFMLPAVGPLANYMFVVLHAPSRWIYVPLLAPLILAVISMGTRWLTDLYKKHGLIGAISGHAVYNGMIGWLIALIFLPWLTIATFIVMMLAYIRVSTARI